MTATQDDQEHWANIVEPCFSLPVKRVNATGGSDYYETAVVRPDLVLGDLVSVLHPNVLPNHTTAWFRHIPRS